MKKEIEQVFDVERSDGSKAELGVDSENNLYINGNKIVTEKMIRFTKVEIGLAFLTALSIFGQAVVSILSYFKICF